MAGNSIYRGPANRIPETHNLPVAGAYLPGIVVTSNNVTLTQAANGQGRLLILGMDVMGGDVATAYASGATGVAFVPVPGDTYQGRVAAATYTVGQALTVNASGQFAAAATGNPVVAYAAEAGVRTAGQLLDVQIADRVAAP